MKFCIFKTNACFQYLAFCGFTIVSVILKLKIKPFAACFDFTMITTWFCTSHSWKSFKDNILTDGVAVRHKTDYSVQNLYTSCHHGHSYLKNATYSPENTMNITYCLSIAFLTVKSFCRLMLRLSWLTKSLTNWQKSCSVFPTENQPQSKKWFTSTALSKW